MSFKTPVLLLTFNRPDEAQQVFNQIRKMQPERLFIAADGPRPNHPTDAQLCKKTRAIVSQIDWPCDVQTLFHKTNLGCGVAPHVGISWFFDHVEEGIILEDDCLPNRSFFYFCEKMLQRYRHDTRIFQIAGTIHTPNIEISDENDYFFGRICQIWGWATWRRAWKYFDPMLHTFSSFKTNKIIKHIFDEELFQIAWESSFQGTYNQIQTHKKSDAWDFQWTYAVMSQNGLSIFPRKNLISNIGFGDNASHTKDENSQLNSLMTEKLDTTNLKHPLFVVPNKTYELSYMQHICNLTPPNKFVWETKKFLKNRFPRLKQWYTFGKKRFIHRER